MIPADLGGRMGQHRLLGQSCSHGEHIKCSPARAELAIDVAPYARPGPLITLLANVALLVRFFLIWRAGWADIYGQGAPPLVDGGAPCCVWVVGAIYRCETISSILPSRSMELTVLGASRWLPLWTGSPQTVPSPSMTDRHMKGQRWSRVLLPSTRTRSTV